MENVALIRYACVPTGVVNTAFSYLKAVVGTGLGVRVMPLGVCPVFEPPWDAVPHVFLSALAPRYINVVSVSAGLLIGTPPIEAIPGLFTVGIPNVAIIDGTEDFSEKELDVLKIYTTVICTDKVGVKVLNTHKIRAIFLRPESDQLSRLFSGMTPV